MAEQPPLLSSLPRYVRESRGADRPDLCFGGQFSGESLHVSFGNPRGGGTLLSPMTCGRWILRPAPAWHGSDPALGVRDDAVMATEIRCIKKRADDRGQRAILSSGRKRSEPLYFPSAMEDLRQPSGRDRGRGSGSSDQMHIHVLIHVCAEPMSYMQSRWSFHSQGLAVPSSSLEDPCPGLSDIHRSP